MDAESNSKVKEQVWHNRNVWNDPSLANLDRENPNDYKVYPEDDGTDSKRNPYGRH
jgi:hypothetical protein